LNIWLLVAAVAAVDTMLVAVALVVSDLEHLA